MLSYDEVDNITQDTWQEFDIDNSWQYKVNVGPEQNVGDSDNTMKIASISVRKNGDTIDRFALDVPLSSQSSGMNSSMKFPDYSKEQIYQISNGEKFIAPENGWVTLLASGSPRYPYNQWYINNYKASFVNPDNKPTDSWPGVLAVTHQSYTNVFIPISKGEYVTHWGSSPGKIYFYPMKD